MLRVQTDESEETFTKISISMIAERTFLSFAAVALGSRVVGYDDGFSVRMHFLLAHRACFLV